jgi:hypothetical protein
VPTEVCTTIEKCLTGSDVSKQFNLFVLTMTFNKAGMILLTRLLTNCLHG